MTRHLRLTACNQYSWRLRNNHSTSINTLYLLNQSILPLFSGLPRVVFLRCSIRVMFADACSFELSRVKSARMHAFREKFASFI